MILEHDGDVPDVHPDAYVASTAVVAGAVTLAADVRVLFGAVLTSEGGPGAWRRPRTVRAVTGGSR